MTFGTICARTAFAAAALSASFVTYETIATYIDPYHPRLSGFIILGDIMSKSNDSKGQHIQGYSAYMRDRYLKSPDIAYQDLERLYGITYDGNDAKIYSKFVNEWGEALYPQYHPENKNAQIFTSASERHQEFDTKGALLMFLSIKAYNREVTNIADALSLCADVADEYIAKLTNDAIRGQSGGSEIETCKYYPK
jgi:hypothetical protein